MEESASYILELKEDLEQNIKSLRDIEHCLEMFLDLFEEQWEDRTKYAASLLRVLSFYARQRCGEMEEKLKLWEKGKDVTMDIKQNL